MEITWYGAASLLLRTSGAAIAFDPFFGMPVGCFSDPSLVCLPADDFCDVTDVFVTHGHIDHLYHLPTLCKAARFQIHCTPTPRKTLLRRGVCADRIAPVAAGVTKSVGPFTVTAYRGRHCRYDFPLVLQTGLRMTFSRHPAHVLRFLFQALRCPQNSEILMYEVACGAKRIQIPGSLGLDADTDYPIGADVLILPFQGRSDLASYARGVVEDLKPRSVLLDHYDNAFPPVSGDIPTENFIKTLRTQAHIPCRAMKKGETIHVET